HRPMAQERSNGKYMYAIIPASGACAGFGPIGLLGGEVHAIVEGPLAAIVSDMPNERLRPERLHLAAHHAVLKNLLARGDLLPMAFGIIADGPEAVARVLAEGREELLDQLVRVAGKVEMTLRVVWDVPNLFEYFVHAHPELCELRDRLFMGAREPSEEEKIELGRQFDRTLHADRAAHAQAVQQILGPLCAEVRENSLRTEREVMNLACLVERAAQTRFEEGIFVAAALFDDNHSFDYSGPWPPYSFVDMALKI
ncbi:MAG: GvpL/GvpF family gas vesicle protein, partial [Planctomycetota bacterium]|nr:GvpL/GvpF family gas vesicle protein [Planctomycetota bacterium]